MVYWVRRRVKGCCPYLLALTLLAIVFLTGAGNLFGSVEDPLEGVPASGAKEILRLRKQVAQLKSALKRHNVPEQEYEESLLPTIYVVTPTYARPHQKAELTRLKSVFLHITALHWIVVEDAEEKTELVRNFLEGSGISYTHLHQPTPPEWKMKKTDPSWYKPRGVLQRNAGLAWLRKRHGKDVHSRGVVYFADDDNTYSIELFKEMRWTKHVSVWPVGLVGGVLLERPLVTRHRGGHKVTGWLAAWRPDRPFATDMAGFAVSLSLLLQKPEAEFSHSSARGFLESDFLEKIANKAQLEPRADLCTKVYVWHTRTEKPNLRHEDQLQQQGRATNTGIEV